MPPKAAEALIATVEAAYELGASEPQWLSTIVDASRPFLDRGLGVGGWLVDARSRGVSRSIRASQVTPRGHDVLEGFCSAIAAIFHGAVTSLSSGPWILSEVASKTFDPSDGWRFTLDGAEDVTGIAGLETSGYEIHLMAPSPATVRLSYSERERWRTLAAHLSAGLRLRRTLETQGTPAGRGLQSLRELAVRADDAGAKARRKGSSEEALETWSALVRGHYSMVDRFVGDRRRYILAIPNRPGVLDIRGLTEREAQVVQYAALGEKHGKIGDRLGVSRSAVTKAVRSAMRKLGVKTQAELVARVSATFRGELR